MGNGLCDTGWRLWVREEPPLLSACERHVGRLPAVFHVQHHRDSLDINDDVQV